MGGVEGGGSSSFWGSWSFLPLDVLLGIFDVTIRPSGVLISVMVVRFAFGSPGVSC